MNPEPPLGMTPDQRNVWDAGAESYRRGLPITTDHPYCCALKDVWELGWKAASEVAPLPPADFAHWHRLGVVDFYAGRCDNRPQDNAAYEAYEAYQSGRREAERRATASKEASVVTTQQLIDAWEKAHAALREHIKNTLPIGCAVMVKSLRYEGHGIVSYYPAELQPEIVAVTLPSGTEWHFLATNVRRVP